MMTAAATNATRRLTIEAAAGAFLTVAILGARLNKVVGIRPALIATDLLRLLGSAAFRLRPLTLPAKAGAVFAHPRSREGRTPAPEQRHRVVDLFA